jgi:hypothetical protein
LQTGGSLVPVFLRGGNHLDASTERGVPITTWPQFGFHPALACRGP